MKRNFIVIFFLLSITAVSAQIQRGLMRNRGLVQSRVPVEEQKKDRAKLLEEKKAEFIAKFLTTLEADEFQLEIIKQSLEDYFDKQPELYKKKYRTKAEFQDAIDSFNEAHFSELKTLISESDMEKINLMIEGKYEDEDKKKKKKRKNRKKDKD